MGRGRVVVGDLIVLPVRRRIHCGMGRFCLIFFERILLILNVLCEGCTHPHLNHTSTTGRTQPGARAQGLPASLAP